MSLETIKSQDRLKTQLSRLGYSVVEWFTKQELQDLEFIISQFQFTFSNNLNRAGTKFNSSFFESDLELKRVFYNKINELLLHKIGDLLDGFDILIANYWEKLPGDGEVLVHQNWTHVDESKYRSFSVWIPLQNTDENNGTIAVVPSSHRAFSNMRGLNMDYPNNFQFAAISNEIKNDFLLPIYLNAGQAIIFDDAIIHYSAPNRSSTTRKAVQLVIKPKEASGLFYFKHTKISGERNVEVFKADSEFYTQLQLVTGSEGNSRPDHATSSTFMTHNSVTMTIKEFKSNMERGKVSDGPIEKLLKRIKGMIK